MNHADKNIVFRLKWFDFVFAREGRSGSEAELFSESNFSKHFMQNLCHSPVCVIC